MQLEDRSVPTVTSAFSGGLLTVTSDSAADAIKVYRADNVGSDYYYTANGVASATFSGVTSIVVNGGDGDDTINASGVATPVPYDPAKTQPTASSSYDLNYDPVYAFNGSGLSGDTHTAVGADSYFDDAAWLSANQTNVDGQYLQEYLGDTIAVSKLVIWNYNQNYNGTLFTNRGVKTADIQISMDGSTWSTAAAGVTLTQAPGSDSYNTPDTVYLPGAPAARYIRILAHANFGTDSYGNFVGLSEVKVYGDAATATVMGSRIAPAAITASTTFSGLSPDNAGNGAGLNPVNPAYHDTSYENTWLSDAQTNVSGQYIQFDLGSVVALDRIRIWNYNQNYYGSFANRGIQDAQIQFSTDGVNFTTILSPTFAEAPATSDYTGFDVDLTGLGSTRFVRIVALSNFGADVYGNYVGLSEAMFFPSVAAPTPALPVTIDGGNGNDIITGGTGPDTLTGGAGADIFVVVPDSISTQDTITDFTDGIDKLNLQAFGVTSLSSLNAAGGSATQSASDVIITLPPAYGTKSLRLTGFLLANLDDSDFVP